MPDIKTKRAGRLQRFFLNMIAQVEVTPIAITVSLRSGVFKHRQSLIYSLDLNAGDLENQDILVSQLRKAIVSAGIEGMPMTITVDDLITRMWIVTPPKNAKSLDDCKAAASLRFSALFGVSQSDYTICADWNARNPFLACALKTSLVVQIQSLCKEFSLVLLGLEGRFVATWNSYCGSILPGAWLAILDTNVLTIAAVQHGRLIAVRSATATSEQMQARIWLEHHVKREALLLALDAPTLLQVKGGLPAQWLNNDAKVLKCLPLGVSK